MIPNYKDNPALLRPTRPVVFETDKELEHIVNILTERLKESGGYGIACNQVFIEDPVSVFVIMGGVVFINPYITESSKEGVWMEEGCLSYPGKVFKIKRPKEIEIEYYDLAGTKHRAKFGGITARVCQHEMDHLNGITFVRRAQQNRYMYQQYVKRNERDARKVR